MNLMRLENSLNVNKPDRRSEMGREELMKKKKREKTGYIKFNSNDRGKCYEIRLNCFRPVFIIDRFNTNT